MSEPPIKQPITAQDLTAGAFKSVELRMKGLGKASDLVNSSLARIGGALTVGAIVGIGRSFLNAADNINDMSDRLGISTEALSQYQHVAKMSGTDFEALANGIKFAQRAVSEAAGGSKSASDALEGLGLKVKDLAAMSPESAFEAIGDAISKLPTAADRTAASMKIFGKSGTELIPVFKDGAAGIRALREEADRLGLTLDSLAADKAAKANDAVDRMTGAFKALGREIAIGAAPAIESFADRVTLALASGNMKQTFREAWKATAEAPPEVAAEFKRIFFDAADPDVGKAAALRYWSGFVSASKAITSNGLFGSTSAPLLPGLTEDGQKKAKEYETVVVGTMLKGLKSVEFATNGLTEAESRYFQALERSVQMAQQRSIGGAHEDWLVGQLMDTDDQTREKEAESLARHNREVQEAVDQYEELRRQSTLTWQAMDQGINMVADQLSSNLAAAITGAKGKLIDLQSIAESIFSMLFRYAIQFGLNAILPGAGTVVGIAAGMPGGPLGPPSPGKAMSAIPSPRGGGGVTITGGLNVTVTGKIDPNDRLSIRRVTTAIYDDLLKIQKHHGPIGVPA